MKLPEHSPVDGFEPANIERIYRGQPALIDGREPRDVLSPRQFEALGHVAEGMTYEETAEAMELALPTATEHIRRGYLKTGRPYKTALAAYFPISPDDDLLRDKRLSDLRPSSLSIIEGLSTGLGYAMVAHKKSIETSSARTATYYAIQAWSEDKGLTKVIRVASALRAGYVRLMEASPFRIEPEYTTGLALTDLAEAEPDIREAYGLET